MLYPCNFDKNKIFFKIFPLDSVYTRVKGDNKVCTRNPHWTESPLDGIPTAWNPHQISWPGDSVPWCPESPLDGIPTARLTLRLHVL